MKNTSGADLRTRTKSSALRVIKLYSALPQTTEAQVLGRQLLRSGTSIGAHHREAQRSRSDAEFISKLEVRSRSWTKRFIGWSSSTRRESYRQVISTAS